MDLRPGTGLEYCVHLLVPCLSNCSVLTNNLQGCCEGYIN